MAEIKLEPEVLNWAVGIFEDAIGEGVITTAEAITLCVAVFYKLYDGPPGMAVQDLKRIGEAVFNVVKQEMREVEH